MQKILVVGGSCLLGQQLKATAPVQIDTPSSKELDLSDIQSIENFDLTGYDTCIMLARAGAGQRHTIEEWPTEQLAHNLDVNVRGVILFLQKWLRHTKNGTFVFCGSRACLSKKAKRVGYWSNKQIIIDIINSIRDDYPDSLFCTFNPPGFPTNRDEPLSIKGHPDELDRSLEEVADWVWYMIDKKIAHIDVLGLPAPK